MPWKVPHFTRSKFVFFFRGFFSINSRGIMIFFSPHTPSLFLSHYAFFFIIFWLFFSHNNTVQLFKIKILQPYSCIFLNKAEKVVLLWEKSLDFFFLFYCDDFTLVICRLHSCKILFHSIVTLYFVFRRLYFYVRTCI